MSPRSLSCSSSACADLLLDLDCSIWFRSWAPSDLLLLTNASTFFSKLSTVSFISVYQFLALCSPEVKSRNSWYALLYRLITVERCFWICSYLLCSDRTRLSCKRALNVAVRSFIKEDCLWFAWSRRF